MNSKLAALGMAVTFLLGASISVAIAAEGNPAPASPGMVQMMGQDVAEMDAMHESMRDQMPEGVRAQCDAMHTAMRDGGAGMMGAQGGWPSAHARHHD